ncbi:hypothetical protein Tco_1226254 [Tanacetum coccineum]
MEIYIGITLRSNISCHIMDCHAGNPCVHKLDQTAKIKAPMIGKMDGYDWQERVEQGRPRSFCLIIFPFQLIPRMVSLRLMPMPVNSVDITFIHKEDKGMDGDDTQKERVDASQDLELHQQAINSNPLTHTLDPLFFSLVITMNLPVNHAQDSSWIEHIFVQDANVS